MMPPIVLMPSPLRRSKWTGPCRRVALSIVIVMAGFAPAAFAQTVLTLATAQRLAVERSRQLVAQDYAVTASREMAVAAGQLPDPVATIGVNNLPINGRDGSA